MNIFNILFKRKRQNSFDIDNIPKDILKQFILNDGTNYNDIRKFIDMLEINTKLDQMVPTLAIWNINKEEVVKALIFLTKSIYKTANNIYALEPTRQMEYKLSQLKKYNQYIYHLSTLVEESCKSIIKN